MTKIVVVLPSLTQLLYPGLRLAMLGQHCCGRLHWNVVPASKEDQAHGINLLVMESK
jgi:hypothetical protein